MISSGPVSKVLRSTEDGLRDYELAYIRSIMGGPVGDTSRESCQETELNCQETQSQPACFSGMRPFQWRQGRAISGLEQSIVKCFTDVEQETGVECLIGLERII